MTARTPETPQPVSFHCRQRTSEHMYRADGPTECESLPPAKPYTINCMRLPGTELLVPPAQRVLEPPSAPGLRGNAAIGQYDRMCRS